MYHTPHSTHHKPPPQTCGHQPQLGRRAGMEPLPTVAGIIGKSRDMSLLGRRQCYTQTQVSSTSSSAAQKLPSLPPPVVVGATEIYVSWRCAPPLAWGAEATDPQVWSAWGQREALNTRGAQFHAQSAGLCFSYCPYGYIRVLGRYGTTKPLVPTCCWLLLALSYVPTILSAARETNQ